MKTDADGAIRVLLIDDDPDDHVLVRDLLESTPGERYRLIAVRTAAEGQAALQRDAPDVCLLDMRIGPDDGLEVLRAAHARGVRVPIIVLTGHGSESADRAAMQAGATDYLDKSRLDPELLERAIRHAVERRRALLRSERRFQALVEYSTDPILLVDHEGKALYASPAVARVTGHAPDEIVDRSGFEFVHPDDLEHVHALFAECLARPGEPISVEYRTRHVDGSWRRIEVTAVNHLDEPAVGAIVANVHDVTHRHATAEQLRRMVAIVEQSHEIARVGSWEWDVSTDAVSWSDGLYRLYGLEPGSIPLTFETVLDRAHPDDRALFRRTVDRAMKTHEPFTFDYRIERPDGSIRWHHGRGRVETDANGRIVRMWGIAQDITERKEAERALAEAHETVRAVIDHSPVAIMAIDPAGRTMLWNPAAEHLFGWTADEVLGHPLPTIPAGHDDEYRRLRERGMRGELIEGEEFTRRTKDGRDLVIRLHVGPIRDARGEIRGMVGVLQDVTHMRELEAQVRQAQKMESIGRLSGGIAHDFNNILTAILGSVEFLTLDLDADDPRLRDVETIATAARRAAGLTNQLLAFSRKQVLVPQVINLNELVKESERLLARVIGEDIELTTRLDPELPAVEADPAQIQQVIMNLAVNARDAMPQGGKLTIGTRSVELDPSFARQHDVAPGKYVMLSVTDTGTGMDADTKANLFEPFFTTKELGKGTGLGLSTVYGIVKQSGGHVSVDTEIGKGSTLTVYLPRAAGVAPPTVKHAPKRLPRGTETLLLVEDEAGVRRLASRILERQGYTVLVAETPGEARQLFASQHGAIALVISDVVMPEESGPRLLEGLRTTHPDLKALFISGYAGEAVAHHGLLGSGTPFLAKPFTPEELARKVRDVLDS